MYIVFTLKQKVDVYYDFYKGVPSIKCIFGMSYIIEKKNIFFLNLLVISYDTRTSYLSDLGTFDEG